MSFLLTPNRETVMRALSLYRSILSVAGIAICCSLFSGCATSVVTQPDYVLLRDQNYTDKILAVMPYGTAVPGYGDILRDKFDSWWLPRWMYGKGEVTVLGEPYTLDDVQYPTDGPYEEMGYQMFNRFRGYNCFKRVVLVKDRQEADSINADFLLVYHINECYAHGLGANWNFVEWISYEGVVDMDVAVYDIVRNERIASQHVRSLATSTSAWVTPEVRNYLRRQLLKGTVFNNAIAEITF